jgi:site-specific DNA-methyltransferase (adenine-specific)
MNPRNINSRNPARTPSPMLPLGLAKKKLGAVIFSPPYANSFNYFESYKLELLAEYYDLEELAKARGDAVRNYRKGAGHDLRTNDDLVQMHCREIASKIPKKEARTGRVDGRSRLVPNLLIGYFTDMERVIEELAACMPQASLCHIVVDRSSHLGVPVPTDLLLANIAMRHGFDVDKLRYCRRSTTSAQQLREFPHLAGVLRKSILTLERL